MRIGLCLLFAGFAADAACAQDELPKEPISGTIQTWYKVTQKIGDKQQHVGYVEESISEAADRAKALFPFSFRYRMEAGLLTDSDARVRAEAATVVGAYADASARTTLEQLVVSDPDAFVRRNAAYALGKIGSRDSAPALTTATLDKSGIVSGYAKVALASLK